MNELTIGNLAKQVGLPTKTIRFYETEGLISSAGRSENGYRKYPETVIDELKVIKYSRDLDLPIDEIKKLLHGCCKGEECAHPKEYLNQYIQNYITLTNSRIKELENLKSKLGLLKKNIGTQKLHCADDKFCCNIFYQIINNMQKQEGGEIK